MVSVRLARPLHYAAEIAARSQRWTLSSLVEVALDAYLREVDVADPLTGKPTKLMRLMEALWDPYESERLVKLAESQRWLLDDEEGRRWKAILEHFKSEGRLTLEQRQELRGDLYETIKKRIADELDQRELPFAKQ